MPFSCTVIEVKTYPSFVNDLIKKALDVLNGELPNSNENCEYCKWNKEVNDWLKHHYVK